MFITPVEIERKGKNVILTCQCHFCNSITKLTVSKWGWDKRLGGELIQRCFPELSAPERELLTSGMCPTCWDKTFGADEDA